MMGIRYGVSKGLLHHMGHQRSKMDRNRFCILWLMLGYTPYSQFSDIEQSKKPL